MYIYNYIYIYIFFLKRKYIYMCIVPIAKVAPLDKDKKLLVSNCLKKKAGERRSFPAGEVNPPPALGACEQWRGHGVSDHQRKSNKYKGITSLVLYYA